LIFKFLICLSDPLVILNKSSSHYKIYINIQSRTEFEFYGFFFRKKGQFNLNK